MDNLRFWLWMVLVFGPGNVRIWEIVSQFESYDEVYEAIKSGKVNINDREKISVRTTYPEQAEEIIDYCREKQYKIITYDDKEYPYMLKNIYNPPPVIFCIGNLECLNDNVAITVVGTRKPSQYSIDVTQRICTELSKIGVVIVSGFALGIDSMAHQSALKLRNSTIAVLGCGIDVDYPKQNAQIKPVFAKCGAVITEFLPGTRPIPTNFPKRNRILSGLSNGTLVIEAANGSGSLITANCAIEQGREIFCVPPSNIFDNRYAGVIKYLRDGAIPVFSHLDIVYEYYTVFSHKLSTVNLALDYYESAENSLVFQSKKNSGNIEQKDTADEINKDRNCKKADNNKTSETSNSEEQINKHDYSELDDMQMKVVNTLRDEVKYVDELSKELGIEIYELFPLLTELEILGVVEALPGKAYKLT